MDILGYFDNHKRPRILIKIEYKDRKKEYETFLDSGADYSLLPKYIGIQLGLKLPDKPDGYSTGIGGRTPVKHIALKVYFGKEIVS